MNCNRWRAYSLGQNDKPVGCVSYIHFASQLNNKSLRNEKLVKLEYRRKTGEQNSCG